MPTVDFLITTDNEDAQHAWKALKSLPDIDLKVWICPPEVENRVLMPFARDETGRKHFGVEGIDKFVQKRLNP